jgi:tetratricopeptide (TPR) repeat protein
MSTNNINSNKCEEKAELCDIAEVSDQTAEVCASCGIAEVNNVKLKKCACYLVKYCSDKCREEHREQHAEECEKRMNELHDKVLFAQPDSTHLGECPICFLLLPMPLDNEKSTFNSCCSKKICHGCDCVYRLSNKQQFCPFCREPTPKDKKEFDRRMMKRVEANDPLAISEMGTICCNEGDYEGAFEYLTKAAELGDSASHYNLSIMYYNGWGVEKDEEKEVYHYEIAAIGGHAYARHNLGCIEGENSSFERSVKHFIIAAKLGHTGAMKALWQHYSEGNITKQDLEATLRTHQAAIDAMKSPQREAAAQLPTYSG